MKRLSGIISSFMAVIMLAACQASFDGSRSGNHSQFMMEYNIFNTTDSQTLTLEEGDIVEAEIVNEAGVLSVAIQKDVNAPIYENENVSSSTFQIEIKEGGIYKITVTGKKQREV